MKAVVCNRPGELKLINKDEPALTKGHAIVRVRRTGICGTDIHAFEGVQPYFSYPRILGHELACELVDADGAPDFKTNEKVTILPYWSCGKCIACRRGKPNCCVMIQVCGVHVDGGMAEYLSVPSPALIHGSGMGLDELALVEPLSIAVHAVKRASIQHGEMVLVVGAGPIGLGIMQFCQLAGANVIAMDIDEQRLEFCRKKFQISYIVNPSHSNALEEIKKITNGDMATAVFDATGNQHAINGALAYLAHGGRYILVGLQKGDIQFNHPEFHKRESTLMSSRNALREDFEQVIACIRNNLITPRTLITHRISFESVASEFGILMNSKQPVVKALIDFDESNLKNQ